MKVSVVQSEPKFLDVKQNLLTHAELINGIESDLIVLPELCTSGYVFETEKQLLSVAEEAGTGESFVFFGDLAERKNCSLVFGFPELDSSSQGKPRIYNSCALVNPDGSWKVYRKTHLFNREKLFFSPGDTGFFVCEAKHMLKIGMMICFDWQFPESARSLALQGAQVICHPSNLVLPWCQQAMKTRSLENRIFSLTANRIGTEGQDETRLTFTGASQILGTRGELLASLSVTESGVATVEINPELADNKEVTPMNNAFADRRPELYTL